MDSNKPIYLKGLNGIRAIAAIGVMLSHINITLERHNIHNVSMFGFTNGIANGWSLGEQGVTMFFVLSGFIITYLLSMEQNKKGTINQKHFYIRRVLRIWPLYYLYLFLAFMVFYFTISKSPDFTILSLYLFLLANVPYILEKTFFYCGQLWSIAVEEQFYLFWPFLFRKKLNLEKILILLIIVFVALRFFLWIFFPFKFLTILFTVNRFDCMMFGGLIAIYYSQKRSIINLITSLPVQLFAWLVIAVHFLNFEIVNSIISMELVTLATAFIICGQISGRNKIINLENSVLNFLGKYSYGIYIYHPIVIYLGSKNNLFITIDSDITRTLCIVLLTTFSTILIAYVSYELIEKRFIKLKDKFSVVHSTNTAKI
jgi:peptidoglycan/LPS O-acetylase OafA/YrhL